ncbi:MAG: rane protein [Hyphomicrobiales bacterium]|jgi:membrane protein|nr:rane protein [Hyphomicrobiales bacterium]
MAVSTPARPGLLAIAGHALLVLAAVAWTAAEGLARRTRPSRLHAEPLRAHEAISPDIANKHDRNEERAQETRIEPGYWPLLRTAASQWIEHKDARLGAALAYYSIFSLGPLIIIAVVIAGFFFGQDLVRGEVTNSLKALLGDTGSKAIEGMLGAANKPSEGLFAAAIGIGTLVFAAVGVVVQLKDALNTVWEVKAPPGKGIWGFARTYVLSFAGVLSLGFLLLISMLVTTALAATSKYLAPFLPEAALQAVSFAVSFLVITLLFAMMFKWLPDADVAWRDVWLGAAVTAFLFELGKFLIGLYIGKQGLESTYGAAASIVVVLIWVYYSAQIVLFGAEFTNVRAKQRRA